MPVHCEGAAMADDSRLLDNGWDGLPGYADKSGDSDEAVTVSISTTPGEWLVNTNDAVVVPMSMMELVEGLRNGKLTERSLVWRAGMQEWAAVDKVPQLKLAARLPMTPVQSVAPAPASVPPRPTPSKPPPKPVRSSTPAPPNATSSSLPSRKATLPFGLPSPVASQSRPPKPRPSSPTNAVVVAAPPKHEEPEVLAVYARPAATISFDLSPEQPLRAAVVPAPPETLAPLTSDSAPRRPQAPRNADLSVVAASQFRDAQRSSKRLVLISSLASAAAASLLTFWIAKQRSAPAARSEVPALVSPVPAPIAATAPSAASEPAINATAPSASASAAPSAAPTSETVVKAAKPAHKRRPVSVVAPPTPPHADGDASTALRDPGSEPNPYDVKLQEDAPAPKPTPTAEVARSPGSDADGKASDTADP